MDAADRLVDFLRQEFLLSSTFSGATRSSHLLLGWSVSAIQILDYFVTLTLVELPSPVLG